jgi:hypothetical protein
MMFVMLKYDCRQGKPLSFESTYSSISFQLSEYLNSKGKTQHVEHFF